MTFPVYQTKEDIINLPWITAETISDVFAFPGVYALVNKITGRWEYIGKAQAIKYRIANNHPVYIPDIHRIKFLVIPNRDERQMLEYRAIELLRPDFNNRAGIYPPGNQDNLSANYDLIFNN
jgi:hypothetical protein